MLLSERQLHTLRGQLLGNLEGKDLKIFKKILSHYDSMEEKMDEVDGEDFFGTEGWRHFFGIPGAD